LHKIQLLHQFLTLYEIDCPSKEFHSDLKLHIPFLLLWVLSLLYVSRVRDVAAIVHPQMCDGGIYIYGKYEETRNSFS
jgi:hypothetical protein